MMRGVDLSNLQGHPDTWSSQPWYQVYLDAQFVIVQGIEPPAGFPGHNFVDPETGKLGYTGEALRRAVADGKHVGVYVWLWNGLDDPYGNIMARLETVPPSVQLSMRPWVDVEDTNGVVDRQDIIDALDAADDWANARGLPEAGIYTGDWYVNGYLGGWIPKVPQWIANYNGDPGSLIGGMIVAHQFTSTPCDQNEMLDSEIVGAEQPTPPSDVDQAWLDKKELVVNTLGYVNGDLVTRFRAEANRKYGPRKKEINAITDELERVIGDALA